MTARARKAPRRAVPPGCAGATAGYETMGCIHAGVTDSAASPRDPTCGVSMSAKRFSVCCVVATRPGVCDCRGRHGCRRRRARSHADLRGLQRPPTRRAGRAQRRFRTRRRGGVVRSGARRGRRALLWTTPWWRRVASATRRWSSPAASSTRRPPARRRTSPGCPAPDPNTARRTSSSRTRSGSSTRRSFERDRLAPSLDATVADDQQKLTQARDAAIASADRGFGARWLAMNAHTLASPGATVLRALMSGLFVLLFLFPLILRLSRAKTSEDRRAGRTR